MVRLLDDLSYGFLENHVIIIYDANKVQYPCPWNTCTFMGLKN